MTHKGIDLINMDRTPCCTFKIPKSASYKEALEVIAEQMKYPIDGLRIWPFITRNNHSFRPTRVISTTESCSSFVDSLNNWSVFVEIIPPEIPYKILPLSEKEGN